MSSPMTEALRQSLLLLSRREYSAHELQQKLQQKGLSEEDCQQALEECQRLGLQSDDRYIDSYCRMRVQQGDGPIKIRHFLLQKGLSSAAIARRLQEEDWIECASKLWQKKNPAGSASLSFADFAKAQRFMQNRGYSPDQIRQLCREV